MRSVSSKIVTVILVLSLAFAAVSCSSADKENIFAAAGKFSKAMADRSFKNLKRASADMDDDYELDFNHLIEASDEDVKVHRAIGNKIKFTVDEESLDISKNGKDATVDVLFEIVDWEALSKDEKAFFDTTTYVEAIGACEEYTQVLETFELVKDHGEWLVSNYEEVIKDFYAQWLKASAPIDYERFVFSYQWLDTTTNIDGYIVYDCTTKLDLSLMIDFKYSKTPIYYTVTYKDKVIYTSDLSVKSCHAYFDAGNKCAVVSPNGFLAVGEYTITFYTKDDAVVFTGRCTVTEGEAIPNTRGVSADAVIYDKTKVSKIKWFFSTGEKDEIIYTDTKAINLDMTLNPDYDSIDCYYEVLYEGKVIYTSPIAKAQTEGYFRSSYSGAPLDSEGNLAGGVYTIIFYDSEGNKLAADSCQVVGGSQGGSAKGLTPADVDTVTWFFVSNKTNGTQYENVQQIDLDLVLKPESQNAPVYYEVKYEGEVVYRSDTSPASSSGYYKTSMEGAKIDSNGNLASGTYTITFYSENGTELASDSCTVIGA